MIYSIFFTLIFLIMPFLCLFFAYLMVKYRIIDIVFDSEEQQNRATRSFKSFLKEFIKTLKSTFITKE